MVKISFNDECLSIANGIEKHIKVANCNWSHEFIQGYDRQYMNEVNSILKSRGYRISSSYKEDTRYLLSMRKEVSFIKVLYYS